MESFHALPRPSSWIKGPTSKGRGGEGEEGRGGEMSRGEGKGKVVAANVRDALTPLALKRQKLNCI